MFRVVPTNATYYTNSADETLVSHKFDSCAAFLFLNKDNPSIRCFSHIAPEISTFWCVKDKKIFTNQMSGHLNVVSKFMKSKGEKQLIVIHKGPADFKELWGASDLFCKRILKKYKFLEKRKCIYSVDKILPNIKHCFSVHFFSTQIKVSTTILQMEDIPSYKMVIIPLSDFKNDEKEHSEKESLLDNKAKKKSSCCCIPRFW